MKKINAFRLILANFILMFFIIPINLNARNDSEKKSDDDRPMHTIININNWIYWQSYNGDSAFNPFIGGSGGIYPHGTSGVIYTDGFLWCGHVQDPDSTKHKIRVGGQRYKIGTQPGWIATAGDGVNPPVAGHHQRSPGLHPFHVAS